MAMRVKLSCLVLLMSAMMAACAPAQATTPSAGGPACTISVSGRWLVNAAGERQVFQGVNLPSVRDMEAAGRSPVQVLEQVAAAGAGAVRMAVTDQEVTPTYVPLKLLPMVERAKALGLILILSWRNDPAQKLNTQADNAEDFLRLVVPALRSFEGVWLDPFDQPLDVPAGRQRAVAERMVDIVRGLGDKRIVVVNNAAWLREPDPELAKPMTQGNVLYGARELAGWDTDKLPVILVTATPEQAQTKAVWRNATRCR
jgi:Cellulase (glycosyl hydrolase family 5)